MWTRCAIIVAIAPLAACLDGSSSRPDPWPNVEFRLAAAPQASGLLLARTEPTPPPVGWHPPVIWYDVYLVDDRSRWITTINRTSDEPSAAGGIQPPPAPSVTADGMHAVFAIRGGSDPGIYVFDRASGRATLLASHEARPTLVADRLVVWGGRDEANRLRGYVGSVDGSYPVTAVAPSDDARGFSGPVHVNPSGTLLAWAEVVGDFERFVTAPVDDPAAVTVLREHPPATRFLGGFVDDNRLHYAWQHNVYMVSVAEPGVETPLGVSLEEYRSTIAVHAESGTLIQTLSAHDGDPSEPGYERIMLVGSADEPDAFRRIGPDEPYNVRIRRISDDGRWLVFATIAEGDRQDLYLADLSTDPVQTVAIARGNDPAGHGGLAFREYFVIDTASEGVVFISDWEVRRVSFHQPHDPVTLATLPPPGLGGDMHMLPHGRFAVPAIQHLVGSTTVPGELVPLLDAPVPDWREVVFAPFPE